MSDVQPIFIGGEWRAGRGKVYATRYPADDTVNAELTAATAEDANEAIEAADAAWRRPNWRDIKPHERAGILHRIAGLIRERSEDLAQMQRRDNGKPITETRALVASAADASDQYIKTMTQAIVASDEMIQKRPDLIQRLVRATLAGLSDMMKDPKGAVGDFIAGSPSFKGREAFIEEVFRAYNELTYQGPGTPGVIDADRLAAVQKFYVSQGIVPKEVPVGELYTNQFVR